MRSAAEKISRKIANHFPALKHKNYRLYFTGQLISFSGSWLHGVAHGWLVYSLTHSSLWLGVVSALSTLPVFFLSLFGGFLVDRFDRKKLLFITQSSSLALAFLLGILTLNNMLNLPILLVITFLSGIANALDNPASSAFVTDLVDKKDLPSAIGLNSAMFNTGRALGPAIAGYLTAFVGLGNIFIINAMSFLAILISLYFIRIERDYAARINNPLPAIKEGIKYCIGHPVINLLLVTAGVGSIFSFSLGTIMPVLSEQVFLNGSKGLGYLLSATGLGALSASLLISSKIKLPNLIALGNIIFIASTLAFSFTENLRTALPLLFLSGFGLTAQFSTIYSTIQNVVKEEYRGRVSGVYLLMFIGLSPVGNLILGYLASALGPQYAIRIFVSIAAFYGLFAYRGFHTNLLLQLIAPLKTRT